MRIKKIKIMKYNLLLMLCFFAFLLKGQDIKVEVTDYSIDQVNSKISLTFNNISELDSLVIQTGNANCQQIMTEQLFIEVVENYVASLKGPNGTNYSFSRYTIELPLITQNWDCLKVFTINKLGTKSDDQILE